MGGKRASRREEDKERGHDSDEDEHDSEEEVEGAPAKFVLPGDSTGNGIDYCILDEGSWLTLRAYCEKWGIKQAHLESIYKRFVRTIVRTEHLDFTPKPQFHASLDFLADEFMSTAGEFAAQIFLQTWFLRRKRGLPSPADRRSVDFARLVVMCCDLARLGDYELLAAFWSSVLHRFDRRPPSDSTELDTRLNTELVQEVVTVVHPDPDKKVEILILKLLDHGEALPDDGDEKRGTQGSEEGGGAGGAKRDGSPHVRYLTLRRILCFCFQHPAFLFPVVQFQRVLRSKIIGSQYWSRRRKPAAERGVNLRESLGLPDAYNDIFDRIQHRRDAWVVSSGHLLLHAVDSRAASHEVAEAERGGGGDGSGRHGQYRQLLDNCLGPNWYHEDAARSSRKTVSRTASPGDAGDRAKFALTTTVTRLHDSSAAALGKAAKRVTALKSRNFLKKEDRANNAGAVTWMSRAADQRSLGSSLSLPEQSRQVGELWDTTGVKVTAEAERTFAGGRRGAGGVDNPASQPTSGGRPPSEAIHRRAAGGAEVVSRSLEAPSQSGVHEGDEALVRNTLHRPPPATEGTRRQRISNLAEPTLRTDRDVPHKGAPSSVRGSVSDEGHPEESRDTRGSDNIQPAGGQVMAGGNSTHRVAIESGTPLPVTTPGSDLLTPLLWPAGSGMVESQAAHPPHRGGRSPDRPARSARRTERTKSSLRHGGGGGGGGATYATDAPPKKCAVCLSTLSRVAMCRTCARRAAKALKDDQGWRQARVILMPYGHAFGVGEVGALEGERDALRRWVRLYDDETGAEFFYNVHYDSSVWKAAIDLPKPGPSRRAERRRKGESGGGGGGVGSAPSRQKMPALTAALSSLSRAGAAGRPPSTEASKTGGRLVSSIRKSPDRASTPAARVVLLAEGEDSPVPEVILDAHKRLRPSSRLVSREDEEDANVGVPRAQGFSPPGGGRPQSRQRIPTGDFDRSRLRTESRTGTPHTAKAV